MKHTPGAWKACGFGVIKDSRGIEIARLQLHNCDNDARLIASAPELLEALKNIAHEMSFMLKVHPEKQGGLYSQRLQEAEQVISKSEWK